MHADAHQIGYEERSAESSLQSAIARLASALRSDGVTSRSSTRLARIGEVTAMAIPSKGLKPQRACIRLFRSVRSWWAASAQAL